MSILSAALSGSLVVQGYFAIWRPSPYGRFAELPVILVYAGGIVVASFCLFVVPSFAWLRRTQRRVSWPASFVAGLFLGGLVMLLFMALWQWPVRIPEMVRRQSRGSVWSFHSCETHVQTGPRTMRFTERRPGGSVG